LIIIHPSLLHNGKIKTLIKRKRKSLIFFYRDIVGNNLHFNSPSQNNGWNDGDNEQLGSLMLYRDILKQNLTTPVRAGGGLPK
jgi:hypothetical protein